MRAAALSAGAIISIGIYLAIASMIGLSASWIAIGLLAIAVLTAIAVMAGGRPSTPAMSR